MAAVGVTVFAGVCAGVCAVPLAAEQQSIQVVSPHFTLVTNAGEKQARHILDNFERMRWMFQTLFPQANVDPPGPILVFAAKNKKEFEALEPQAYLAFRDGDMAAAQKTYTEAVDLDSQSYIAHYNFASISQSNGNATDPRFAPA